MKFLNIILIFLALTSKSLGQIDHLTPCPDLGVIIPEIKVYESDLNKVLLQEFNDKPIARYLVQPSFDSEYAFQIQQDSDDNYILVANCLKTNLWYCENRDTIKVEKFIKYIEQGLAEPISILFKKVLQPGDGPCYGIGRDGTTYRLYTYDKEKGLICGETWSPDKGSKMFELISICEAVFEYSKSPSERDKNDLIKQIDNFLLVLN
jgi:hypothetical protein